ncbi:MAG TPA: prepilin-type N-terminal cleavage/methylation domain-containing protein [Gammaproteobacteria bacterium]|nr:prepilin-type N-terminal cleavage/methylation domain-containing protein [Gammaproteobacteria bacterium]
MFRKANRIKRGFTLLELMAAFLVMAIVAGVAIPTYREYIIRGRMTEVVTVLNVYLDVAKQQYVSYGTIPTTINGVPARTATAITTSPCISHIYYDDGVGTPWANVGKGAMVQAIINDECGKGIPGYTAGVAGAFNRITVAFKASGELLTYYCGTWLNDGSQVPLSYLPSGCQNNAFKTLVTG